MLKKGFLVFLMYKKELRTLHAHTAVPHTPSQPSAFHICARLCIVKQASKSAQGVRWIHWRRTSKKDQPPIAPHGGDNTLN